MFEVIVRVQIVGFGCLDNAVDDGTVLRTRDRVGHKPVPAQCQNRAAKKSGAYYLHLWEHGFTFTFEREAACSKMSVNVRTYGEKRRDDSSRWHPAS